MNNFEFYNPVKVVFGKDQVDKLSELIPNGSKILLAYGGGSVKKTGLLERIKTTLSDYSLVEFGGIMPNPQYEKLKEGIELAKNEGVDFLLAVGGGSVIDATKFMAAAMHHPTDPWGILGNREPINGATKFGCVLTLPATGSEMNAFSVISNGDQKIGFGGDPRLFAQFSILDPTLTYTLPEKQLGNGIVDAFVHVTEQYITKDINTPIQDSFAEGILKTLITEAPRVIELKDDYDSRANFMWAATCALNGVIGNGVVHDWATHMIGHNITALHGLDHARSLAVVLPSLLRLQKENKKAKLLKFAKNVWGIEGKTPDERIELAINLTEDFFNSVGVPTKLKAYKIQESDIDKIVESLEGMLSAGLGEDRDIDAAKAKQILTLAL